jgi:hypothetical protein
MEPRAEQAGAEARAKAVPFMEVATGLEGRGVATTTKVLFTIASLVLDT